jgi:hypothetical protein
MSNEAVVHIRVNDNEYRFKVSEETLSTIVYDGAVPPYELVVLGTEQPVVEEPPVEEEV